jgi:CheY-like chemotaxis protein
VLDFSKIDSGQLALEIAEFSIRSLVHDIGAMARREAEKKSLYLHTSIDDAVPEFVLGDSHRLQQTLFNIVINAVKFTETGGIDIRVFRENCDRTDAVTLVFEVRDTGIGIAESKMTDLFKPLFSADTTYTRKYGGMGMGLAVSHGLATLMGGKIICESRLGEGSIFRLFLPLSLPAAKIAKKKEPRRVSDTDILHRMRVLVAEDNKINQMIIKELLSAVGIDVTLADNGIEALALLRTKTFDLVLMDIQMPEMDGLTATAQIRSNHRYDDLPIVAMTANVGLEFLEESRAAGMDDFLTKPVEVDKLYDTLIKWRINN